MAPGSKPLTSRDWLFGSRPRRLLLTITLTSPPPREGWTKTQLAGGAEVGPHGGVDEHVAGLQRLGLLVPNDERWLPASPLPPLAKPLTRVLRVLEAIPDDRWTSTPRKGRVTPAVQRAMAALGRARASAAAAGLTTQDATTVFDALRTAEAILARVAAEREASR